jgi:hypothetical protein
MGRLILGSSVAIAGGGGGGNRTVGDEIFVMTNGVSDGPLYGFDSYTRDPDGDLATISITRVGSGGPANRPYLNYQITSASTPEAGAGWNLESPYGNPSSPVVTRGQSLFVRFSYLPIGDYDQTQKIVQQNPGINQRSITTIKENSSPDGFYVAQGINGGDVPMGALLTGFTIWRNVQIELRFSTTEGATDGYQKAWVNNDTYASPTGTNSGLYVSYRGNNIVGEEWVTFAGLHQGTLSGNIPREFHIADFRVGPTFDSNWHASGL